MVASGKWRQQFDRLARCKERIATVAIGYAAKRVEAIVFDWLFYGFVIATCITNWGPVWGSMVGFATMAPLSALVCFGYIRFYDWAKKDWLGFETLKELKDETGHRGRLANLVQRVARFGDVPAFLALCVYGDPFMVTVYLRRGARKYDNLSRRDWAVFWTSVVVSNGYWTLRWTVIVEVARIVWKVLPHST
jgi:hypothetical protein